MAFACGTGIISNAIAPHVRHVTGIDISDKMINIARQKAEQDGIKNTSYTVANLEDDEIQAGKYDVITAFNVLYFLKDLEKKLKLIYDMLPENGYFLSVTDCIKHKKGCRPIKMSILMKLGIVPYFRRMGTAELTGFIEKAGLKIFTLNRPTCMWWHKKNPNSINLLKLTLILYSYTLCKSPIQGVNSGFRLFRNLIRAFEPHFQHTNFK